MAAAAVALVVVVVLVLRHRARARLVGPNGSPRRLVATSRGPVVAGNSEAGVFVVGITAHAESRWEVRLDAETGMQRHVTALVPGPDDSVQVLTVSKPERSGFAQPSVDVESIDRDGNLVARRANILPREYEATAATRAPDGGLIVVGHVDWKAAFVARFGADGSMLWERRLDPREIWLVRDVVATSDRIAVVGQVTPIGRQNLDSDMAFVLLDHGGVTIKATRDGHAGSNVGNSVIATLDGFVVAGHAGGNYYDGAVWRMGANGEVRWIRRFSPDGQGEIDLEAVVAVSDGFVAVGRDIAIGNSNDVVLAKISLTGELVWRHHAGNSNSGGDHDDFGIGVVQLDDGFLVAAASGDYVRTWLLRFDPDGSHDW